QARFQIGLDAVRAGDVIDLDHALAVGDPALDDLHLLQRRAVGVAHGPDDEARRLAGDGRLQVPAHRHALFIADLHQVGARVQRVGIVEGAEEADLDAGAAGAEGLAAGQCIPDRVARVLLSPNAGEPPRAEMQRLRIRRLVRVLALRRGLEAQPLLRRYRLAVPAAIVFFRRAARHRQVAVGAA